MTRAGSNEDATSSGDLDITDGLTITGDGARSTIVAGGPAPYDDRVFHVLSGAITNISALTITAGKLPGGGDAGGGIRNEGDLTLHRVALTANTAGDRSSGGAIYSEGPLDTATITNITISGNRAGQFAGGVLALSALAEQQPDQ